MNIHAVSTTISNLRYAPAIRGYPFTLNFLDDFGITEAYNFFKWLLGKETRQGIKDLASVQVPDQHSFAEKVFSVTGGRVGHIRRFVSDMRLGKALPTGMREHRPHSTSEFRFVFEHTTRF